MLIILGRYSGYFEPAAGSAYRVIRLDPSTASSEISDSRPLKTSAINQHRSDQFGHHFR